MRIKTNGYAVAAMMAACFVLSGCTGTGAASGPGHTEPVPALLAECDDNCHGQIQGTLRQMTGSRRVMVSRQVFKTGSMLVLSNYRPGEAGPMTSRNAGESEQARFLLHIEEGGCVLSRVDDKLRILNSRDLANCVCRPGPKLKNNL